MDLDLMPADAEVGLGLVAWSSLAFGLLTGRYGRDKLAEASPAGSRPSQGSAIRADILGRPAVVHLTPGTVDNVKTAPAVLTAAPGRIRRLLAEKGYDADWLRAGLRKADIVPVLTGTRARKRPVRHDKRRYEDRRRAETVFCRSGDFRRVATRYDKPARNYASAVALASLIAFWC